MEQGKQGVVVKLSPPQNPLEQVQARFKELENGFRTWLAKQSLPVEAAVVTATSAAQGAAIGGFMGVLTNDVSSSLPTPQAGLNPQAMASFKQAQVLFWFPLFVVWFYNFFSWLKCENCLICWNSVVLWTKVEFGGADSCSFLMNCRLLLEVPWCKLATSPWWPVLMQAYLLLWRDWEARRMFSQGKLLRRLGRFLFLVDYFPWDHTSIGEENETFFVMVWKPLFSICVIKTCGEAQKGKPKENNISSGELGLLQMVLEPTGRCTREEAKPQRGWHEEVC